MSCKIARQRIRKTDVWQIVCRLEENINLVIMKSTKKLKILLLLIVLLMMTASGVYSQKSTNE
jgi:hypothetical protein